MSTIGEGPLGVVNICTDMSWTVFEQAMNAVKEVALQQSELEAPGDAVLTQQKSDKADHIQGTAAATPPPPERQLGSKSAAGMHPSKGESPPDLNK